MSTAVGRPDAGAIRVRVTIPAPSINVGGLTLDPFGMVGAAGLDDIVSSLLFAPIETLVFPSSAKVYPLCLPTGEGFTVPIERIGGEFGVWNHDGVLVLTVPAIIFGAVRQSMADVILDAKQIGANVQARLRLPKGRKREVNTPFGPLGIEAV